MGVPINDFWAGDISLSVNQKIKLRGILATYAIQVIDDLDGNMQVYVEGEKVGEWNKCTDCHTTNSYNTFSCVDCHEHGKSKMDSEHDDTSGYTYRSISCYSCHPQGNKSGRFDHNTTSFPLTGAHTKVDCTSCHTSSVGGTSSECNACHQKNYNEAQIPNHTKAGIS